MPSVSLNENSVSAPPESQQQGQPGGPHAYPPPPPHQQQPPPPPSGHHQYPGGGGYPPYPGRTGYEHGPPQHHVNNSDTMAVSQQHPYQHPYPPHQQPPMRFPGKPLPGGPPGPQQQQQPPPGSGQYPPQQMRSGYPPTGPAGMTGQSISQPTGPTPTLNQLLQPGAAGGGGGAGGGGAGGAGATGAPAGAAPPNMPGHGGPHRYPPPPTGYEHANSYNMPPHSKSDYPAGPQGWPPPAPNQRPPVNSYGHPPPPPFQQQAMYRQNAPPTGGRSSGAPPGPPPQHPGQYYQPPGMHHPPPHQQQNFPPPPPQSPHYPPPHPAQRYPGPGSGMRPGENQPPSHYPPGPGMPPESSGLAPPGPPSSSGPDGGHPPKSTPPPPQSPSLAQQQMNHAQNNPPSPQQSPRSTPVLPQHPPPQQGGLPPSSSPSHRPQGASPSSNSYPPPDAGECNSNDSGPGASGVRPSPSPTGSASSRSMSPAVGSQNIPMPPRPNSSQSDGSMPQRMSQSPMPGSYSSQMAPPPHHGYPPSGKMNHPNAGMIPPGHPPPPSPQHYPQGQQHWSHPQHQSGQQQGYRPPHHGGMMSPYPPPPSQQPMPPSSYPPPRHPVPNHVGGPPPPHQSQYSPYPPPQFGGPQPPSQQAPQPWASPTPPGPGAPQNPNSRSHPPYLKQQLSKHNMGFSPPPHGQGYAMGPPQTSNMSTSPSQTPPPGPGSHGQHGPPPHMPPHGHQGPSDVDNSNSGGNPPNIVSVGPDGTNVDDLSQQSTLSNTSGASGGDDGPAMPKLRKEGSVSHQNYASHPTTPQSNAVPSPGAASMSSAHEEYGEMNSPGWPRTPASPGLNSHPQPPSEQYKPKPKKPDSLQKLYDMDDNPDRRSFLDKLMQYMDEHNTPITACPTISKNPLDLFRLYFLVKERGGFLEVTKNKTWKDIAGSLGIGASSSAAYTLRKHYTKHLLPFECKFDRGGIDPQPLINQVESTSKKKGPKVAPVPSPGSSNSQDSFQGANNNSTSSMDGFNSMPSAGTSGGPPAPYGVHPPSDYNQSNSGSASGPVGPGGNSSGGSSNSTPPLRPPTQSPVAPPPQSAQTPPQPPHPHTGEKTQVSASNPFDDMQQPALPPHHQQQYHAVHQQPFNHHQQPPPPPVSSQQNRPHYQYHAQYSTSSSTPPGYQGQPGSYPPYSSPSGDQYPGPGRQPHEAYNQQGYGGPGYPPPGPGRPMYPQYPETSSAGGAPPSQSGYPPHGPGPHQSQGGPSQQQQLPPTSSAGPTVPTSVADDRYNMGPPPPGGQTPSAPPGVPVNYQQHPPGGPPPHQGRIPAYPPTSGAPGHPPPNGYPNQDYYHSQPPPSEQGYSPMPGQTPPQPPAAGKHGPPPHTNQRRLDFPPGKDGTPPGAAPQQGYPGYPQSQPRMPSYDGQGSKGGYIFHPPLGGGSGAGGSAMAGGAGGRDHGSGTPNRSSPSPSPAASSAVAAAPNLQSASSPHHHHHHSAATSASQSSASTSLPPPPPPPAPTPLNSNNINKPPWIPPEGWPTGGGQYPSHQRPYPPGPPNAGAPPGVPPHGAPPPPQPSSPAQTSATPPQPGGPPSWPSPNTTPPGGRGAAGPAVPPATPNTPGAQGWPHPHPPPPDHPSRYGPGAGPQTTPPSQSPGSPASGQQPPWVPPGAQGRSPQMRPPFPVPGKGDMYKGYGPPPGSPLSPAGVANAGPPPVPGSKGAAGMPPPPPAVIGSAPGASTPSSAFPPPQPPTAPAPPGLPLPVVQPPVPAKKEIVFPPDSVEAVTPVLSRRKKLHKSDVAPVEAWRIMMCLKSGLLAETTWALDVLNVLLYDDHSISYFSLSYLPGLLDSLLEQLRRALILVFGNSIGIEMNGDKIEDIKPLHGKKGKWYEVEERGEEEEPDIGTPRRKFPRDGHRTVVLQGATNYTMMSRIGRKTVGIVAKDDEPFVVSGPRDWDADEKARDASDSELGAQNIAGGLMELTKHVVTSFTADLNIVPVVRVLKQEPDGSRLARLKRKRRRSSDCAGEGGSASTENSTTEIKRESEVCDDLAPVASSELNLDLYRCETKLPNEVVTPSSSSNSSNCSSSSEKNIKRNPSESGSSSGSSANIKTELLESNSSCANASNGEKSSENNSDTKNCQVAFSDKKVVAAAVVAQQNNRKLKKLDELMDRIKSDVTSDNEDDAEHCGKRVNGLPDTDDNCSLMMDTSTSEETEASKDQDSIVNGGVAAREEVSDTCATNVIGGDGGDSAHSGDNKSAGANSCDEASVGGDDNILKNCVKIGSILVQDHGSTLKRRKLDEFEDECYTRDEPSLYQVTETQDALARRCLSIFNILRNLTFVPGNEMEFGKSIPFLGLLGKLILIHHDHPLKGKPTSKKFKLEGDDSGDAEAGSSEAAADAEKGDKEEKEEKKTEEEEQEEPDLFSGGSAGDIDGDSCTSLSGECEWWWEYVHHLREHVLVMIANISGQMDLSQFSEEISRPILDGLLHWAVCPAAYGQDPFPTLGPSSNLSPQRLAIEALCKLSVTQGNMDLLLATPPYSRIEKLCQLLCRSLCPSEDQVMREFAINLLSYLSAADSGVARTIALQNPCISLLISFIEQAEVNANSISMNHGFQVLRDNPEAMGTSLDMLRRAATTLFNLARHPDNRALFVQHEPRLLSLVMSHILEQKVAAIVAQVLFQCSAPDSSSSKYFHSGANYDTFYSIARSRSIVTRKH